MVFGVEPELCATYEAYFGSGTKLTVLGKFGHHILREHLETGWLGSFVSRARRLQVQSNKESEKSKLKLRLWVPA